MLISGCLITKNAQDFLRESISSYIDYVDELIVVDDFSDDNTLSICKSFGNKVKIYQQNFNRDKKAQRQFYVKKARGKWIFCPDSDEVYHDNDMKWFKETVKEQKHLLTMGVQLINFWKTFDQSIHGGVYDGIMQRMFRNNGEIGYHDLHHTVSWKPGTILFKYAIEKNLCITKAFKVPHYSYLKHPDHIKDKIAYYMRRDNPNCRNKNGEVNEYLVEHYTNLHPYFSGDMTVPRYGDKGLYCCGAQKNKVHSVKKCDLILHPKTIRQSKIYQHWKKTNQMNYKLLGE